jgi:hypothetical protein
VALSAENFSGEEGVALYKFLKDLPPFLNSRG